MANPNDIRESFPSTESGAGAGVPLTSVQPGSASAGVNGAVGFAYQDINGNVILPSLDAQGRLPVTTDSQGTRLRNHGMVAGAVMSATGTVYSNLQQVLSIPLTANKTLGDFCGKVVCRRDAYFKIQYSDSGGSSVLLDSTIVGPGQYSAPIGLGTGTDTFLVPASASAPALTIQAGNFSTVSDLHATLAVLQF